MQTYIPEVIELHIEEAAYLFDAFIAELDEPESDKAYLQKLSVRLNAHLEGLTINADPSWELVVGQLDAEDEMLGGVFFVGAYLAFYSGDIEKIKMVVDQASLASCYRGVAYGLAWHPWSHSQFWAEKFISSKKVQIAYIGYFAYLTYQQVSPVSAPVLLERSIRDKAAAVLSMALKVGESCRDTSLLPVLKRIDQASVNDEALVYAALVTRINLGDTGALNLLKPYVFDASLLDGLKQDCATELAFAHLGKDVAKEWIAELKNIAGTERLMLIAIGAMQEKNLLSWVVSQMQVPALARIAGKVFERLSGYNLAEQAWLITDGSMDEHWLTLEGDEDLEWPDALKIKQALRL